MRIGVTGAHGFVGKHLLTYLRQCGHVVVPLVRQSKYHDDVAVGNIGKSTPWARALDGMDIVIHAAARAHRLRDDAADPLEAFRSVNVAGTRRLAEACVNTGVRRLVFISSIKVHGESTAWGHPFHSHSPLQPLDPYGRSKAEAEEALRDLASTTPLEVVIVRPPLVYGPEVPANFRRLLAAVARGVPLPLGSVRNARSMVSVRNLANLVEVSATSIQAEGKAFLISDGEDISTSMLVQWMAEAMNRKVRILRVPEGVLRMAGSMVGKPDEVSRLVGNLQVDIQHTTDVLGWRPPFSAKSEITATAVAYLQQR